MKEPAQENVNLHFSSQFECQFIFAGSNLKDGRADLSFIGTLHTFLRSGAEESRRGHMPPNHGSQPKNPLIERYPMKVFLTALLAAIVLFAGAALLSPAAQAEELPPSVLCAMQCNENFLTCQLECTNGGGPIVVNPEPDYSLLRCWSQCQNQSDACHLACGT